MVVNRKIKLNQRFFLLNKSRVLGWVLQSKRQWEWIIFSTNRQLHLSKKTCSGLSERMSGIRDNAKHIQNPPRKVTRDLAKSLEIWRTHVRSDESTYSVNWIIIKVTEFFLKSAFEFTRIPATDLFHQILAELVHRDTTNWWLSENGMLYQRRWLQAECIVWIYQSCIFCQSR